MIEVIQGPQELPSTFLEHLCEAYYTFTPIEPNAPDNQSTTNIAFVTQYNPRYKMETSRFRKFLGDE